MHHSAPIDPGFDSATAPGIVRNQLFGVRTDRTAHLAGAICRCFIDALEEPPRAASPPCGTVARPGAMSRALLSWMARILGGEDSATGRSLAYVWAFGATCLAFTILLPHPAAASDAGLILIAVLAYPIAALMFFQAERLPRIAIEAFTYLGQLLITALTLFWGAPEAPFLWFHVWLVVHSFHFLPPVRATRQVACAAVLFVAATLATDAPFPGGTSVVGVGTIVIVGLLVGALRVRVDELLQTVRAGERLFRSSFENAPIGKALVDLEGRFLRVNRAMTEILGHRESALLELTFQDISHPDDLDADTELFQQLVGGEVSSYELDKRYIHADGHAVWAALHASLVRDEGGVPVHAVAQVRDITHARASELELGRYRALIDSAEDAIYAVDLDDRIVTWNGAAERLYGYAAEQIIGRPRTVIVPNDRRDETKTIVASVLAGKAVHRLETTRRRRDGSIIDVQITFSPVRDGSGQVVGASTIARDISDRVAAERARDRLERDLARARDRYAGVLAAATESSIIGTDAEGTITVFNAGAERMLGYGADELVGRSTPAVLHDPAELSARAHELGMQPGFAVLSAAARQGGAETREWTYVRKDGGRRRVSVTTTSQRDETQTITGFLAIATDVTEIKRAEELFRGAFEDAPIGVALCVAAGPDAGALTRVNHALDDLLGCTPGELVGTRLAALADDQDRPRLQEAFDRLLRTGAERVRLEQRLKRADGRSVWALVSASLVHGGEDMAPQVIVQFLDISERKSFEGRLQHLADHDALTGLLNRRRFEAELERSLAHSARYGGAGAVLLLDLDGFKHVNDTLGHSAGDELITRIAGVLEGALRTTDVLARLGGDEFAVILPEATETEALAVANKLLDAVRRHGSIDALQRQARVTTSIGLTLFDSEPGLTGEDVIAEADIAMYDAKDGGRDGVKVFRGDDRRRERVSARATWLERLRSGLEHGSFRLLAQPISALGSDDTRWFELLLRFEDECGDLIAPGSFLYLAERFDLIADIDRWVLGQAVRMLHAEQQAGRELRLAVNLSAKTLADQQLGDDLAAMLAEHPIAANSLVVEVTESAAIANIEHVRAFAERLHELGCRVALDDFGAGFASFYYLRHLSFDYLKIDGEFVRGLAENATDQLVVQAIVSIARGLRTETVAEFVGDDETHALLRRLGVDYAQGYHLGRPAPLAELVGSP
jgi:diguanylate cyclase (GGDEF)-like protein/PAS domain S-box-containing protein